MATGDNKSATLTGNMAVIYARVSSKEQEKEGFSIPAQQKLLKEYAKTNGIGIAVEFTDIETAKRAGRTDFNRMIRYIKEQSEVKAILVEKTDRLYRNFRDYVIVDELDVEVHLVKENEILSKDSKSHQKFIHGIKVLMAKNYIDNLSEEVKKGMAEKVSRGGYPHKAPVGYRNDIINHIIVADPEKASYVRKIYEMYSTGENSLADIRRWCISKGFRSGWGTAPISKSKIELILKNPFYTGMFRWKGKIYKGSHEPIITGVFFIFLCPLCWPVKYFTKL